MDNAPKRAEHERLARPLYARSHRLRSIVDCNRLLGKLANAALMGKIEPAVASRVAYIVNYLIRGIELGDLENRIAILERKAKENEDER